MAKDDINLLKTKTGLSPQLAALAEKLRVASLVALVFLLLLGIVVTSSFILVTSRYRALEAEKVRLSRQITADSHKEGLLMAVKHRAAIVEKALASLLPWGTALDMVERIALLSTISSVTVDEVGEVTILLKLVSLNDALNLVRSVMALTEEQALRRPKLTALSLQEDGYVELGISFLPVFPL